MGTFTVKLRTHSIKDVTYQAPELNNCCIHGIKPLILEIIAGRDKDIHYVANCVHDDCNKIASSLEEIIGVWNKFNKNNLLK